MRRSVLLAALPLVAATAVAARADYPPTDCHVTIVMAAAGEQSHCNTIGTTPVVGGNRRVLNLYVQTGQATATLGCGGAPEPEVVTILVTAPYSGTAYVDRTGFCWLTVTATVDGTTATATNTTGRTVD